MIRTAKISDVPAINELITASAELGLMLFRPLAELYEKIRQFVVWEAAAAPAAPAGCTLGPWIGSGCSARARSRGEPCLPCPFLGQG